jgi:ApbE superfamily uncharacterized protein (UPF0280 family)
MTAQIDSPIIFKRGLYRVRKLIKQSNLLLVSNSLQAIRAAIDSVIYNRRMLENYLLTHHEYLFSLEPVKVEEEAPRIVKLAASAAEIAGVGPMAAISGALAELAVESMLLHGSSASLVENGGEIAALSSVPLNVGVYAGSSPISGRIGFHLSPDDFPVGIATSSATVSHSLNFGEADAAVIIADTASLADAIAKAVCNAVQGDDAEASVQSGLEVAEAMPGVRGAVIVRGRYVGTVGKLPKLLKLNGNIDELFKASFYDVVPSDVVVL